MTKSSLNLRAAGCALAASLAFAALPSYAQQAIPQQQSVARQQSDPQQQSAGGIPAPPKGPGAARPMLSISSNPGV